MNTAKPSKTPKPPGYWYALIGFLLGSLESVAFNVLAAFIGSDGYTFELWQSLLPALLGAAVWPVALLVSVEVLARVEWEAHWGWWAVRVSGIVLVALASAVISYGHIHAVLKFWKYGWLESGVGPLVIDGQMLISGFALYTIGRAARAATNVAQAAVDASPAPAELPARPDPSVGQDAAVSVTAPTPQAVAETAPTEPPAPATRPAINPPARIARAAARPAATRPPRRQPTPPAGDPGDDELIARLRANRTESGDLPTESWARKHLGIGQGRAARLIKEAARPDLHTVTTQEVAVG